MEGLYAVGWFQHEFTPEKELHILHVLEEISIKLAFMMLYFILKVGLEAEYQEIRNRDPTGTFYHARMSANVLKNRYTDVPSYDHSRVVLATEQSDNKEDEDSGDFINANFVDGCVRLSSVSQNFKIGLGN